MQTPSASPLRAIILGALGDSVGQVQEARLNDNLLVSHRYSYNLVLSQADAMAIVHTTQCALMQRAI